MPRSVLECSARDQLLPESETIRLNNRLLLVESEKQNVASSLEQQKRDCALLQLQLQGLQDSRREDYAPLRAVVTF